MAEDKSVLLTLNVQPNVKFALRKEAARQGFITAQKGSISRFMNYLADRLDSGVNPFTRETFEESIFSDLQGVAESLQVDCSLSEKEVADILSQLAQRRYDGLQSQALSDIILDVRAILFGEEPA